MIIYPCLCSSQSLWINGLWARICHMDVINYSWVECTLNHVIKRGLMSSSESQLYGYPGRPVQMGCQAFKIHHGRDFHTLDWSKRCVGCEEDWALVARVDYGGGNHSFLGTLGNRVNISIPTGALNFFRFQRNDTGQYRCKFTNEHPTFVNLTIYGMLQEVSSLRPSDA